MSKTPAPGVPDAHEKKRIARLLRRLEKTYPDARCALDYRNPFELLVATILSAQCTDVRVNMVTPALFKACPTPAAMARASTAKLEKIIRSTGFYRNKARNLLGCAQRLTEVYDGQVPDTMQALLNLPGVARKTANVVLGNAFGRNEGMVVDTHIGRLSRRLGLSSHDNPVKVETDLMARFPRTKWTLLAHLLIAHGRACCTARKPACTTCPLTADCPRVGVSCRDAAGSRGRS